MMSVRGALACVVLCASLACGDGGGDATSSPSVSATASGPPGVSIAQPGDGSKVAPGDVVVSIAVTGFDLSSAEGSGNGGHVVYYRGLDFIPTDRGSSALTAAGSYHTSSETTHTWSGVKKGKTTFGVQLVNADDTPLDPPVTDTVVVTVTSSVSPAPGPSASAPSSSPGTFGSPLPDDAGNSQSAGGAQIRITSPDDDSRMSGEVEVVVEVDGFRLVNKIGQDAREGEGHIIYYAGQDYDVPTAPDRSAISGGRGTFTSVPSSEERYVWSELPRGRYTLAVQLVASDNTPLEPPRVTEITVDIR